MGNLIFLIVFLFGFMANAEEVNLLKNPGFESRTSRWSNVGAGTFTIESASPLEYDYSGKWNPSATSEFLRSTLYTVPIGMLSATCSVEIKYLWDSGVSGEILLNVDDGTGNIASIPLDPTSGGISRKAFLAFSCPSSGGIRLELESTAAAAEITLDGTFLGSGRNTLQISQYELVAEAYYPDTASCISISTTTTFVAFPAVAACPPITVTHSTQAINTADNDLIDLVFDNLRPGKYKVSVSFHTDSANSAASHYFKLTDGVTESPICIKRTSGSPLNTSQTTCSQVYNYAASGARTFTILGKVDSPSNLQLRNDLGATQYVVEKIPESSAEAITLETTGASWSGYHDSTCSWARTNVAYGDPTADASCNLVESTNSAFGSVSSSGSTLPNIVFTPKNLGVYNVCAIAQIENTTASAQLGARLYDGSVQIAEVGWNVNAGGNPKPSVTICGLYDVSSITAKTISLQTKVSSGSLTITNSGGNAVQWSIYPISQQFPTPVFTDLTNSLAAKVSSETPNVKTNTCNIVNTAGAWSFGTPATCSTWIDSLTDIAVGDVTANFTAGVFTTQLPTCFCTTESNSNGIQCAIQKTGISTSAVNFEVYDSAGTPFEENINISCTGL